MRKLAPPPLPPSIALWSQSAALVYALWSQSATLVYALWSQSATCLCTLVAISHTCLCVKVATSHTCPCTFVAISHALWSQSATLVSALWSQSATLILPALPPLLLSSPMLRACSRVRARRMLSPPCGSSSLPTVPLTAGTRSASCGTKRMARRAPFRTTGTLPGRTTGYPRTRAATWRPNMCVTCYFHTVACCAARNRNCNRDHIGRTLKMHVQRCATFHCLRKGHDVPGALSFSPNPPVTAPHSSAHQHLRLCRAPPPVAGNAPPRPFAA